MDSSSDSLNPRQRRTIVTEEALHVSPALLGLPLASPWIRAAAIAVDGILVAILTNAPSVVFGLAAALVLFRVSRRKAPGVGYIGRSFRFMFRLGGAMVLFGVAVSLWGSVRNRFSGEGDGGGRGVSVEVSDIGESTASLNLSGLEVAGFATEVVALHRSKNQAEAQATTRAVLQRMQAAGVAAPDARQTVREIAGDVEGKPWLRAGIEAAVAEDQAAEGLPAGGADAGEDFAVADSTILAYAAALAAADSARADSLRPPLVAAVSADTVEALDGRFASLEEDRGELERQVEELRSELDEGPGMMSFARSFAEDLGLGLGWIGLYFTATTALWQGRTPGKRLFGIRVIRLTGKPIGWWASFERFGGYAAGVATGLLGFLQIFWDDNRQATHDKIAGTAVIRER